MLVLGTLIYNEILIVPISFMCENTKPYIEARNENIMGCKDSKDGSQATNLEDDSERQ